MVSSQKRDSAVYGLVNHDLREVYFGVGKNPAGRVAAHCAGETVALEHWDCENNVLEAVLVEEGLSQSAASSLAHHLEREGVIEGLEEYEYIRTSGI